MREFYDWLGGNKAKRIRLAVMDMWKPFRNVTNEKAPQAAILFTSSMSCATWMGRRTRSAREYARLSGREHRYIKGQKE